jgi:hypothetical protein
VLLFVNYARDRNFLSYSVGGLKAANAHFSGCDVGASPKTRGCLTVFGEEVDALPKCPQNKRTRIFRPITKHLSQRSSFKRGNVVHWRLSRD